MLSSQFSDGLSVRDANAIVSAWDKYIKLKENKKYGLLSLADFKRLNDAKGESRETILQRKKDLTLNAGAKQLKMLLWTQNSLMQIWQMRSMSQLLKLLTDLVPLHMRVTIMAVSIPASAPILRSALRRQCEGLLPALTLVSQSTILQMCKAAVLVPAPALKTRPALLSMRQWKRVSQSARDPMSQMDHWSTFLPGMSWATIL